jgi:hypothetical protein
MPNDARFLAGSAAWRGSAALEAREITDLRGYRFQPLAQAVRVRALARAWSVVM